MEKRNTLDKRFINLRQVFHDFQTSVRFSTSNSPTEIFANQLKSYEFLGQLEEHFVAEKVQYLYEFVHSIFSLIFTMIKEGPSQRSEKVDGVKKLTTTDVGTQTEESLCEDKKKMPAEGAGHPLMRHKKRAGLEIQIFQKDLTQMSFRERRRALQKMRDMIYAQEQQTPQQHSVIKDFKPNIDKISYSKSDQSIKSAIDTFKESDISTHIFLKHFMEEFVEIKDIKSSSELFNKEVIQSMSRAITKYKGVKYQGKGKFRLFSHTIEEIIYPTIGEEMYEINVRMSGEGYGVGAMDGGKEQEKQQEEVEKLMINQVNANTLVVPKRKISNDLSLKDKLKRSRFPSLMARHGQQLNPISQIRSHESIASSNSSISSKPGKKKINRKKLKSSFSQDEFSSGLGRSSLQKDKSNGNQIPLLLQKNTTEVFNKSRQSFRLENKQKDSAILEQETIKERMGTKAKKLRKRKISNFVDRREDRVSFRQEKVL